MNATPNDTARAVELVNEVIPLLQNWARAAHGSATPQTPEHDDLINALGELVNVIMSRVIDDSLGNDWPGPITNHER